VPDTTFPEEFVWGAAAAAYQIEGAAAADGKGPSVWDMFCRQPGAIWQDQNGDVACDHYHRYPEDVALMRRIGLGAYRLSISWPRVFPEGVGRVSHPGLDFYDRLIDELVGAGIEPWVTLFHWDYPLALYDRGGWLNRDSVEWFGEYTERVVLALSDRVSHWLHDTVEVYGHVDGSPHRHCCCRGRCGSSHDLFILEDRSVMRAASFVPMPNSATLNAFAPRGSSFSKSAFAAAPPRTSTATPFLTRIVIGRLPERLPMPAIEPSTTKTPSEAPRLASGRLLPTGDFQMSPVHG